MHLDNSLPLDYIIEEALGWTEVNSGVYPLFLKMMVIFSIAEITPTPPQARQEVFGFGSCHLDFSKHTFRAAFTAIAKISGGVSKTDVYGGGGGMGEWRIRENYRVNTAVSFSGTISIVFNQRLHKLQRRESMPQFPCA